MEHDNNILVSLALVLRRVPADKFQREAVRLVEAGEVPPAELLLRCGIRTEGMEVVV